MSTTLKYWFNIESFYDTIRPGILLLKFFGLLPFSIIVSTRAPNSGSTVSCDNDNLRFLKSKVKCMDVIIFTLWQIFYLQMLYASWPSDVHNYPFARILTIVTLLLHLISGVFCSTSAVLAWIFRRRFVLMIHLVEEADRWLYSRNTMHSKIHLVTVLMLGGTISLNCSLVLIDHIVVRTMMEVPYDHPSSAQYVFLYYYILRLIHLLSVTVFIAGLYGFRERLRTLNKQLRTALIEKLEYGLVTGTASEKIQGFAMIYNQLCDGLRLFCTIFVWQPMFLCATLTVSAVFAVLTICNMLEKGVPVLKALAIAYSAATLLFTVHFLLIVQLGNDVKKEGKLTAALVHKAINHSSTTPEIVERLLWFSRYLQHQTPVVSCGLFCFDWTLVLSIISALATYSIIMIQFELGVPQFFISAILRMHNVTNE